MLKRVLVTAAALAAFSGTASASVTYDFTALSAYPTGTELFSGSFSLTVPGFISADATIPTSQLNSCSASSNLGPATCGTTQFFSTDYSGYDTIEFGVSSTTNPGVWHYYYFDPSAFTTPGTYSTVLFGSDQAGTLVVSTTSAVPEPAAWMLLLAGAGVLSSRARRRTQA